MNGKLKIVLASKSPRRSEILKTAGFDFEVRVQETDETLPVGICPEDAVVYLAAAKAKAVDRKCDELVIGADTVVVLDGKILGKPTDKTDAFNMIKSLSGRIHSVYTGVCTMSDMGTFSFAERTDVEFLKLTDEEIEEYINTDEPYDKAGAYGIQGLASKFIKGINGDYFNVVGLPISSIYQKILKKQINFD